MLAAILKSLSKLIVFSFTPIIIVLSTFSFAGELVQIYFFNPWFFNFEALFRFISTPDESITISTLALVQSISEILFSCVITISLPSMISLPFFALTLFNNFP